ncbi:MAG: hypothetical protein OEN21_16465 [Myxococcales bacterium]|nr:hypothetical protein [Myxococcales bacterium]
MRPRFGWVLVSAWLLVLQALLGGCTGRAEAVRAAQPYVENFGELRSRALKLLELRTDVARKRLLVGAVNGDEESLPDNMKPLLERFRASGNVISEEQLEQGEAMFWRMFDFAFSKDPNVLQAELLFIERDGSVSSLRYPRERDVPVGVNWHGLRQNRTFAGLTNCVTDDGSEPCVMLQLRPRDHPGSAGLTVAYRRTPLEVTDESDSDR